MKKTFKKRAFISAIAMLVVSAIVLTSATFAWFSMAKQVQVESMDLNITSPDGIQISANTTAWTTSITQEDLNPTAETTSRFKADTGHTNHFPELLTPSSSRLYCSNSLPAFFSGSIGENKLTTTTAAADKTGGYVVFDIFIQVAAEMKVYWGTSTITSKDNTETISSMRLALVNCGTGDKTTAKTVLPANTQNNRVVMFEPLALQHTAAAVANGMATQGTAVTTQYVKAIGSNIVTNKNIIESSQTSYIGATAATAVNENTASTNAWFTAGAGINRVRVYLWMEGNDVDCANDVAGSTISFNLILTIA